MQYSFKNNVNKIKLHQIPRGELFMFDNSLHIKGSSYSARTSITNLVTGDYRMVDHDVNVCPVNYKLSVELK